MRAAVFPTVLLFGACEIAVRSLGLDEPRVRSKALPEELFGAIQPDPDLFWSLKPDLRLQTHNLKGQPIRVSTNSLGLRSPEPLAKKPGEVRILSLGESSTFGAYVDDKQTYSRLLEQLLNAEAPEGRRYRVINGGVSAYSSFQSLMYLKLRGWKLEPDVVLFYHEFNDYLPSSLRSSSNDEWGMAQTDRELYASRSNQVQRWLLQVSGVARAVVYWLASRQVSTAETADPGGPAGTDPGAAIGLLKMGALPGLVDQDGQVVTDGIQHDALPRRVSEEERLQNFQELAEFCREKGIQLVVIHPSYRLTRQHTCVLTEFCESEGIPMFEAIRALARRGRGGPPMFLDLAHPSPLGHRRLAQGLTAFLRPLLEDDGDAPGS